MITAALHRHGTDPPSPPNRDMNESTLHERFRTAVSDATNLDQRPDNMTLLRLYGLYKQASAGDVSGERPGFTDLVGRTKWDAWNELAGTSSDEAMQHYIDLVEELKDA